jgi:hypothetical protein
MSKIKSFTAFVEEKKKNAPQFELFGEVFTLPHSLSYNAVLQLQALRMRNPDEAVDETETFSIFSLILGKENVEKLRQFDDFTIDLASEMVKWALDQYNTGNNVDPKLKKLSV